jgi:CRP-like cAMP-binding protein
MDYDDMRQGLERFGALEDETWGGIATLVSDSTVAPGQHLLRAGNHALDVFFIRDGLVREYYVDQAGHEATRRFCLAGEFSGSLADLLTTKPAAVSIEALEPTRLCRLSWARLDLLSERSPDLMRVLRRIAEGLYLRKAAREFEMLTLPAVTRYRRFVGEYPMLAARLPRHLIASYLGITPVHLSRIAGERSRRSPAAPRKRTRSVRSTAAASPLPAPRR